MILLVIEYMSILISCARNKRNDKIRSLAVQVLKNTARSPDYERYLVKENAMDMALGL